MAEISEALDAVADELYAVLPGQFIAARDARVKQAKADGDKDLADQAKALRRPSVAAWLINVLARSDDGLTDLTDLSAQLREAQSKLDGAAMKTLGQQRNTVVAELTGRAVTLGAKADPAYKDSAPVRDQVTATLNAAVADPAAEQAVASGRLVSPLAYAGFGEVDLTDAVATPLRAVPAPVKGGAARPSTTDEAPAPTPEPPKVDEAALKKARKQLADAERRLEVAEEAFAQARSRRHQARLDVEKARLTLEDLEDA
ncbi:hypothetical protein [Luteipulveratus mongoliensis]|uniref:hypothetical protein n=1 Tax=Luteipulveratus mongoliensis TaxID=571913 RepID=UPI000697254B|nr:hypothetical protein [Luteipulveratus mongoliensis]